MKFSRKIGEKDALQVHVTSTIFDFIKILQYTLVISKYQATFPFVRISSVYRPYSIRSKLKSLFTIKQKVYCHVNFRRPISSVSYTYVIRI